MRYRHIFAASLACFLAVSVQAFDRGDLIVHSGWQAVVDEPLVARADITVFDAAGKQKLFISGSVSYRNAFPTYVRALYAAAPDRLLASAFATVYVSPDAKNVTGSYLTHLAAGWYVQYFGDIVPLRSGEFLVIGGGYGRRLLFKFDEIGTAPAVYKLPSSPLGPLHAEVLPDQCTVLYSGTAPVIHAYDICRQEALPDFAVLPWNVQCLGAMRLLPNGDLLVATCGDVRRLDKDGREVAIYPVPASQIALTLDASGFWAAIRDYPAELSRIQFRSADRAAFRTTLNVPASALAVVDEWRASLQPPPRRRVARR